MKHIKVQIVGPIYLTIIKMDIIRFSSCIFASSLSANNVWFYFIYIDLIDKCDCLNNVEGCTNVVVIILRIAFMIDKICLILYERNYMKRRLSYINLFIYWPPNILTWSNVEHEDLYIKPWDVGMRLSNVCKQELISPNYKTRNMEPDVWSILCTWIEGLDGNPSDAVKLFCFLFSKYLLNQKSS